MESKISKCITGFRESHGRQHCLIAVLEKWKKSLDKEKNMPAVIMDLSKAFHNLNHGTLLAKLKAYGFSKQVLSFICGFP